MSQVRFTINPKDLADVLANAVEISKEKSGVKPLPLVMLAYQPAGKRGMVVAYGVGRYAAGRTVAYLDGLPTEESASVCIDRDVAAELQGVLRKVLGGKKATVSVTISPEPVQVTVKDEHGMPVQTMANLHITSAEETLADLLDTDPEGKAGKWFDWVDDRLAEAKEAASGPLAFQTDIIARLNKIRAESSVVDLKSTGVPNLVAVALGSSFRGVMGEVNRESYVAGGPWGDGGGSPDHLF